MKNAFSLTLVFLFIFSSKGADVPGISLASKRVSPEISVDSLYGEVRSQFRDFFIKEGRASFNSIMSRLFDGGGFVGGPSVDNFDAHVAKPLLDQLDYEYKGEFLRCFEDVDGSNRSVLRNYLKLDPEIRSEAAKISVEFERNIDLDSFQEGVLKGVVGRQLDFSLKNVKPELAQTLKSALLIKALSLYSEKFSQEDLDVLNRMNSISLLFDIKLKALEKLLPKVDDLARNMPLNDSGSMVSFGSLFRP